MSKKSIIATLVGAVAGWAYYFFVGCKSGSCFIAGNWYIAIPYGGLLGYLFFGSFLKSSAPKQNEAQQ